MQENQAVLQAGRTACACHCKALQTVVPYCVLFVTINREQAGGCWQACALHNHTCCLKLSSLLIEC